ncbi:MAG: putative rane protein [Microbacteriaceae bacterium]|jgi:hypothetical protein|nr:putative rane protein [Microbacteriaceae bacterium]HEV7957336.1 DUF6704 family protein [Marisediminicola sp.]
MSSDNSEPGHGNSPAAWTAVIIMLVAVAIGTIAFFYSHAPVVWASAALLVVGLIVGAVLAKMGYGADGDRLSKKDN